MKTPTLLLHVCCAPCASACLERLLAAGHAPLLWFSNSNLDTAEEFTRRLDAARLLAAHCRLEIAVDPYDHAAWLAAAAGSEADPEGGARCRGCFTRVLARAAEAAGRLGCPEFTTSLTVSPHKHSPTIFAVGGAHPGFAAFDFKKRDGFRRSLELSRQIGLYRQDYCGCEFSRRRPPAE